MNSVMKEALGTIALHAQEYAIVSEQAGDPDGAAAYAAIADMLAGIQAGRGSPLLTVATDRKVIGRDHAHHAQTQHALAIAAEGMRAGMDRAEALKVAAEATGRTQKALQKLGVIPADRAEFERWYASDDSRDIRGAALAARRVLTSLLRRDPTWGEFVKHVGGLGNHYGAAEQRRETTAKDVRELFKRPYGEAFIRVSDLLGQGLQRRLSALMRM